MKRTIKLNESDLHRIIKESIKKVLNEEIINAQTFEYEGRKYTIDVSYGSLNRQFRSYIRKEDGDLSAMADDNNNANSAMYKAIFKFVCNSKGIYPPTEWSHEYYIFTSNPPKEVEQGMSYIKKQLNF